MLCCHHQARTGSKKEKCTKTSPRNWMTCNEPLRTLGQDVSRSICCEIRMLVYRTSSGTYHHIGYNWGHLKSGLTIWLINIFQRWGENSPMPAFGVIDKSIFLRTHCNGNRRAADPVTGRQQEGVCLSHSPRLCKMPTRSTGNVKSLLLLFPLLIRVLPDGLTERYRWALAGPLGKRLNPWHDCRHS